MKPLKINYLAVLVAAIATFVLGAIWYIALGQPWMEASGITEEQIQSSGGAVSSYVISFIIYIIMAFAMATLFKSMGISTLQTGFMTGLLIGTAFIFGSTIINNQYGLRPFNLSLINGGFGSLSGGLMGAILGAWKKYAD